MNAGLLGSNARHSSQTERTCGQVQAVQQVLKEPSVKVETSYYLGWILSLYDTLHGMCQDR